MELLGIVETKFKLPIAIFPQYTLNKRSNHLIKRKNL